MAGEERPVVGLYKSRAATQAAIVIARELNCRQARERGERTITIAHGDVWMLVASAHLTALATRTLGGTAETVAC